MKISLTKFGWIILGFLVYFFIVNRIVYITSSNLISFVLGTILILCLLAKGYKTIINKYNKLNCLILLLCVPVVFSTVINSFNWDGALLHLIRISSIFLFFEYFSAVKMRKNVVVGMLVASITMQFIVLYYINFRPLEAWQHNMDYFNGTKFSVSYNIINGLLFSSYLIDDKKMIYKILIIVPQTLLGIYICQRVFCTTGLIMCICLTSWLLLKDLLFKKGISRFWRKGSIAAGSMVLASIVALTVEFFISSTLVQIIVVDVLGKSLTLTGRTVIYSRLGEYFQGHMLFGHGYNSVYTLFKDTMLVNGHYCYDAQNSLLEYALYFGIIGISVLLMIIYAAFSKSNANSFKLEKNEEIFIFGFYLYAVVGIFEIIINPTFFMLLALIASRQCTSYKKQIDMLHSKLVD